MTPPGGLPHPLTAGDVLDQVSTGVVVIDRDCALLFANAPRKNRIRNVALHRWSPWESFR